MVEQTFSSFFLVSSEYFSVDERKKEKMRSFTRRKKRSNRRSKLKLKAKLKGGRSFTKIMDRPFHLGWTTLTFLVGRQTNEEIVKKSDAFRLESDLFVRAAVVNSNDVELTKHVTVAFFQGLGSSLSKGIESGHDLLKSFSVLGYNATVYVMDQMQALSPDRLIACAAELIDRTALFASQKNEKTFYVLGFSMGSAIATQGIKRWNETYTAAKESIPSIPKIILLSPFTTLADARDKRTKWDNTFSMTGFIVNQVLGHNFETESVIKTLPYSITLSSPQQDDIIQHEQFLKLGSITNSLEVSPRLFPIKGDHHSTRKSLKNPEYVKQLFFD